MTPNARRNAIVGIVLVLVVAGLGLLYTRHNPAGPGTVTIGWVGALTGDVAAYGQAIKAATEIAVDEVNQAGGIGGKPLRVVYEDDQIDPKKGVAALQKLLDVDRVPLVIQALGSSVMLAEAPIAERRKVVLISPSCSNNAIRDAGDYIFRTWPSDAYQGEAIAKFVATNLQKSTAAVLFINNDYGVGAKDEFARNFAGPGREVILSEGFLEGDTDFRAQIAKVKASRADVLILASHYKEAGLILKQARELGLQLPTVAADGCFSPDLVVVAGDAAEGAYVMNMHWDPKSTDSVVAGFVANYKQKAGKDPEAYAAAGYDCLKVVALAIGRGGVTSDGIKQALYGIKGYRGVTGDITFDENGEVRKQYDVFLVTKGAFGLFKPAL